MSPGPVTRGSPPASSASRRLRCPGYLGEGRRTTRRRDRRGGLATRALPGRSAVPDEESSVPDFKLTAEPRTEFGKGAARRLRRADKIPAVLYGHGTQPVHVALPGHATMLAL